MQSAASDISPATGLSGGHNASGGSLRRPAVTAGLCLWLIVASVLGAGLRLYQLDSWSLWEDELYTVRGVSVLGELHRSKVLGYLPTALALQMSGVDLGAIDPDAPHEWRAMGITEGPMRIASCLIGIITIPILGLACARLLGARAAGIFALLLAVAPWHIYWSQATRFYTQQFLFYSLALILYFGATQRGSRTRLVVALIFAVLAFLSQPTALFIAAVFAGDWLFALLQREPVRLRAFGWGAAIVALALCLGVVGYDVTRSDDFGRLTSQGDAHRPAVMIMGTAFVVTAPVAIFAIISAVSLVREQTRLIMYLALAAVVPPLVLIAIYLMGSYVHVRYAFPCLFGWLALAAVGLGHIQHLLGSVQHRSKQMLAYAPLAVLLVAVLIVDYEYFAGGNGWRRRWKETFAYLEQHRQPGEAVYCEGKDVSRYYLQDANVTYLRNDRSIIDEMQQPTWLIAATESATGGRRYTHLDEMADLRAYFEVRIVQPFSSLRVYYYDPNAEPPDTSAANPQ